jgi:hypothetical protein
MSDFQTAETTGADTAAPVVSDATPPVLRVINGHRHKLARIEVTHDGESFFIVGRTRVKYKVVRALGTEETMPSAFCALVTEHNLVDQETGEPLPVPLTEDHFGDVDFSLLVRLVKGLVAAISAEGN